MVISSSGEVVKTYAATGLHAGLGAFMCVEALLLAVASPSHSRCRRCLSADSVHDRMLLAQARAAAVREQGRGKCSGDMLPLRALSSPDEELSPHQPSAYVAFAMNIAGTHKRAKGKREGMANELRKARMKA